MNQIIIQANLLDKARVGTDQQYEDLLEQINSIRDTESMDNTNLGCWRSAYRYKNIEWLMDAIRDLVSESIDAHSSDQVFKNRLASEKFTINYWTNINQPGARNVLHTHENAAFSGVYYLKGKGTGDLRILNPSNIMGRCNDLSPYVRDFVFKPSNRDLIMWPSWLPHEVEPNLSNEERINIAFDITFI